MHCGKDDSAGGVALSLSESLHADGGHSADASGAALSILDFQKVLVLSCTMGVEGLLRCNLSPNPSTGPTPTLNILLTLIVTLSLPLNLTLTRICR